MISSSVFICTCQFTRCCTNCSLISCFKFVCLFVSVVVLSALLVLFLG